MPTNTAPHQPRILCVHQGFELYGSDRMFVHSLAALRRHFHDSHITVHLPCDGPLLELVQPYASEVILGDNGVVRRREGIWRFLRSLPRVLPQLRRNIENHDIIYVNSMVMLGYLMALGLYKKKKKILHVHEIMRGHEGFVVGRLVRWSGCAIIANSRATLRALGVWGKCVHNGIAIEKSSLDFVPVKQPGEPLRVLLLGRLNGWKGHDVALEALYRLSLSGYHDIEMRIVGNAFGDDMAVEKMIRHRSEAFGLEDHVHLVGYDAHVGDHYSWADVVIVPSTRPEPFGLVALEAMKYKKPVIAANHGGLSEIVVHRETGLLVKPKNAVDLAHGLMFYYEQRSALMRHGQAGYRRVCDHFSVDDYQKSIISVVSGYVASPV